MSSARDDDPGLGAAVPFRFACSRCGHCCSGGDGYVWLEDGEIASLARSLDATDVSLARCFVREVSDPKSGERRRALVQSDDGRCALLVGRNTCSVYAARPAHCRTFPYWLSVMQGGGGFEAARATCRGIAVVVDEELEERAFALLEALYARLAAEVGPGTSSEPCCLETDSGAELFVSALEADHAVARGTPDERCRLGPARPLGCRQRDAHDACDAEIWRRGVRSIERELGYPAAYGAAHALLHVRGFAPGTQRTQTEQSPLLPNRGMGR